MFTLTHGILGFELVSWIIWTLIIMAVSYGVAYLTKKDPKDIKYDPDTFDFPEIKEGTKFPIIAGTCWMEAPIVGWFGDIYTEKLGVRLSDTDGQYVYLNKYYYGALHILAQGFCDGVIQIKVGDILIWPDSTNKKSLNADAASSAVINLPELYGGIHEHNAQVTGSGGIVGTVNFQYGASDQTLNTYLASQIGSYISANRGLTTVILRRPYIGLSSQLYQWKYLVKRTDYLTSGEAQWYSAKAAIRTYEINPIHWLREIYTDTEWGLCTPTENMNDTNLKAAADALYGEGFGLCIKWEGEQSLENHVKDILHYINGVIYEDHLTGLIEIKLIRDDYVADDLEEFDETDIVSIEGFTRGVLHKIPDVTYVKYWDMYNNLPVVTPSYDMSLAFSQDETLIPNDVDYTGVVNDELAGQLAARDQQQLSSFAATMTIKCKRTMSHLHPGDVFKLSYAPLGVVSMIVRIATPHYGTLTDGIVTFECIEDIFGMKNSLYAAPPSTNWDSNIDDPVYDDEYLIAKVAMSGVDPTVTVALPPVPTGGPGSGREYYITGDDLGSWFNDADWVAQTFTPSVPYQITSVKIKLRWDPLFGGTPGTMVVSIRAATTDEFGDSIPTGADLCSGTLDGSTITQVAGGDWYEITFGDGVALTKDSVYAIVVRSPADHPFSKLKWRVDTSSPSYSRGNHSISANSGSNWSKTPGYDCMFETWGT